MKIFDNRLVFLGSVVVVTLLVLRLLDAFVLTRPDWRWSLVTLVLEPNKLIKKEAPGPTPEPTVTPTPNVFPQTLVIPKLKLQASIESVGTTETGHMEVPKNASNVGWYRYGSVPSMKGNAVITGHYDTPSGRPAIFYRLGALSSGDTIEVQFSDGSRRTFVVTGKDSIPRDVFPGDYVFATKYGTNLNLITCTGIWNRDTKLYSHRLVVFTTLKGTQFSAL